MTQRHNTGWLKVCSQSAMGLVLGAVVGTAQANGTMSGYQDDVESLDAALSSLVESYRADTQAGDELATFKQQWESVEYHEAVEDSAKPLYPLIWQAIGQLENTLDDSAAPSAVNAVTARGAVSWCFPSLSFERSLRRRSRQLLSSGVAKCAAPDFWLWTAAPPRSSLVTSSCVTVLTTSGPVMCM